MHCSANVGRDGDVALFFGLSGTGKTTLSADPVRALIGDDEHGWFDRGVFNFEGGCYAKVIKLNPATEPEIYDASLKFGTVLENVEIDPQTRSVDFDSERFTENTRSAYQIDSLRNIVPAGVGGIPKTIFMLTYDAFGVLPPISRLTPEQAHVFLHARLHGEGSRDREGSDGAPGDVQLLFRRAVSAEAAAVLRGDAEKEIGRERRFGVAPQHGNNRGAVRGRKEDAASPDEGARLRLR